jgi:glutathione synthase/RimK-type ligase-like ATP-grasp enzyme
MVHLEVAFKVRKSSSMGKVILIVGEPGDLHSKVMATVLAQKYRLEPYLLNMREFPLSAKATFSISSEQRPQRIYAGPYGTVDLREVRSVWWRRPDYCVIPRIFSGLNQGDYMQAECDHFLQGNLWGLNCLWVNDPMRDVLASRKVVQLSRARAAGLRVPRTLITNSPDEARAFVEEAPGRIISKRTGTSPGPQAKTSFVSPEMITQLQAISTSPTIFQDYVEAGLDLRVIWIAGDLWAVSIDSQAGSTPEDCRFDLSVSHTPHVLPTPVQEALTRLMEGFGLVYGAIDLRIGVDGEYYFLEVNPAGQFAYLEILTGLPLMDALASILARGDSSTISGSHLVDEGEIHPRPPT